MASFHDHQKRPSGQHVFLTPSAPRRSHRSSSVPLSAGSSLPKERRALSLSTNSRRHIPRLTTCCRGLSTRMDQTESESIPKLPRARLSNSSILLRRLLWNGRLRTGVRDTLLSTLKRRTGSGLVEVFIDFGTKVRFVFLFLSQSSCNDNRYQKNCF